MWFVTVIFANLRGRPTRSLLTISGVAVAVAAVVSLVGVVRGFEKSLLELYQRQGIDLMVHQGGRVQMTSSVLPQSLAEKIAQVPGVAAVYPSLVDVLSLLEDDMMGVVIQGWPAGSMPLERLNVVEGQRIDADTPRGVLLGARLAAAADKRTGDSIELLDGEMFEVLGVFDSHNVFDSGSMVTRLDDLQQLMLREHEVTIFAIVAEEHHPAAIESLREEIAALQSGIEVSPVRELAEQSAEIQVARAFAWLTSTIALVIGSIGMLNTMLMAVFERTREIAMLRALGWRRRRIIGMILGEASVLCSLGAAVGIIGAVIAVHLLSQAPAAARLVAGNISWEVMLQGWGLALLLGLLGGLYPAWSAARVAPAEGLRHD